ncbi:unnamed protein product, partial [Mesorhabditis belari]|uniref:SXP/RAL-2 family protein Ani s 5-like cation-binding domain-containing protein n=1 Tax=Mesorhabditis belari TaxID=2138241 RepID=A0AAF3F194_9BILA
MKEIFLISMIFFCVTLGDETVVTSTISPEIVKEFWQKFSKDNTERQNEKAASDFIAQQSQQVQATLRMMMSTKFAQIMEEVEQTKNLIASLKISDAAKKYVDEATKIWKNRDLTWAQKEKQFETVKQQAQEDPAAAIDFAKVEAAVKGVVTQENNEAPMKRKKRAARIHHKIAAAQE